MTSPRTDPPITDRAKRVLQKAREEQQRLGHPTLTPEHVLYGLLGDLRSVASFVLRELKVDEIALAVQVSQELARRAPDPSVDEAQLLEAARAWVSDLKQVSVGTEHLLLAVVGSGSAAAKWLAELGVSEAVARSTTERLLAVVPRRSGPTTPPPS